jgi:hypothetical protein
MYVSKTRTRTNVRDDDVIESIERVNERLLEIAMEMVELNILL